MLLLNFAVLIFLTFANAANIAPKISNGQDAEITEFPFLISIQEIDVHVCVASLLNERWALSAARCFNTRSLRDLNIEFGFSVITPGPSGENKATISQIVMHEDFITSPLSNDIALIELSSPIVTGFHEPFARLVISGGSRFRAGTTAAHAGWGHVRQNVRTNILQKGEVFVMTSEQCEEFQRSARQICAKGDSVICTADLGAPLLVNGILVGVASFRDGPTCDNVDDTYPNVYTDVSYFVEWIEEKTGIDYQLSMFLQGTAR